jgi:hypothetical protein
MMMKFNFLLLSAAALFNGATAAETVNFAVPETTSLQETGISTVPDSSVTGHIAISPIEAAAITG